MVAVANAVTLPVDLLAELAQAGDAAALEQLAAWFEPFVYGQAKFATRRFGGRLHRQLREECVSAGWPIVLKCLRSYVPGRPFQTYLRSALWRHWLKAILRPATPAFRGTARRPQPFSEVSGRDGWWEEIPDNRSAGEVGSELASTDAAAGVQKILEKMPPAQAGLLRIVYGISVGGLPVEPVRVRDLERQQNLGRNVLSNKLTRAQKAFARYAKAAGLVG
jgi:DNA-directed RNA polymerase specialized sigma24 family protein